MKKPNTIHYTWWNYYVNYIEKVVLSNEPYSPEEVSYWRNNVFCKILTYFTPLSIIALVPSVIMAFSTGYTAVGVMDLMAFLMVTTIAVVPGIRLEIRKGLFIFILYVLSVVLLYYLPVPGPGLLFLLATPIFASLIYSSKAAYLSAILNTILCIIFALLYYYKTANPVAVEYTVGSWIAVSSNLVLLSFTCAKCLDLLLSGLATSLRNNKITEAKLEKSNRLYQFVSQINQTIVHVEDVETLYRKSCSIAVEFGNYTKAWISSFDQENKKLIIHESRGISEEDIALFSSVPYESDGPMAYVLKTGSYFLSNDIENAHEIKSWKPFAEKHNIGSCIILPIKKLGSVYGTFSLYATESNYFQKEDITTLIEVTGDISFALNHFEQKQRHHEADMKLLENYAALESLSEEQSAILNTLPANIALLDNQGTVIKVNDQWIQFGEDNGLEDVYPHVGKNYIQISVTSQGIDAEDGKKMAQGLQSVLNGDLERFSMEYPCNSPVEKRWFKAEVRPFKSKQLKGVVVMHLNVSQRKRAESEMLLLINNTEESFILLNIDLHIVSFNNQFKNLYQKYFGIEIQKGDSILDYVLPERKEIVAGIYERVLKGSVEESELYIPRLNDFPHYFTLKYSPAKDEYGSTFGVFVTAINITEKKKAEQQKEFEKRDKEALINSTNDLIWSISKDFKLIAANHSFIEGLKKLTGIELKQGDDLLNEELLPIDFLNHWRGLYSRALNGETFMTEIYTPPMNGLEATWVESSFNPIYINEKLIGTACYTRNITEQKTNELIIRANEARLAEAQSIAKLGNWETDLENFEVIWSDQTLKIFDYQPEDLEPSHQGFLSIVHPDDRLKVDAAFENSFDKKGINKIEHRIITKKGDIRYIEERWQILHDKTLKPMKAVGTCQDITERKKSEHENKFKAELLDTIGQSVIATDLKGHITFWNKAAETTYGWTLQEALGKNFLELVHDNKIKTEIKVLVRKLSEGDMWSGEFYAKRKNGNLFPALVYYSPVYDEFGKQIGIIGISNDISERKENELERAKITSDLLQRNRDLEQFTFIISHNLRAPTANIIGFTEILKDETITPSEQKELLYGLSSSVHTLDTTIKDINSILQLKKEISEKKEVLYFSKIVNDIIVDIENSIFKHQVEFITDFSEVDEYFALKAYMHSVFYNLINNSIKYRKFDMTPIIEIKSKKENNKVILTFKDNGMGFDMKVGEKIFALYKRMHSHVEGKGMGLFMVKTQVEAMGGNITVTSEINKGTEFTIVFEN